MRVLQKLSSTFRCPRLYWTAVRVYLLILVLLVGGQRHFLYQPERLTPAGFMSEVHQTLGLGAEVLPGFDAVVLTPAEGAPAGTAVLFHGNAGLGLDRAGLSEPFLARGYRLVLAEYPGYGAREGWPSEPALVEDARALVAALRAAYPGEPLTLVGESLGSGVAVQVAASVQPAPDAVVLLAPFKSLVDTASHVVKIFPVRLFLSDKFESDTHILGYGGPVRVLVADEDNLVTANAGLALHEIAATRGPTVLVRVPNAGHNDWSGRVRPADWDLLLPGAGAGAL